MDEPLSQLPRGGHRLLDKTLVLLVLLGGAGIAVHTGALLAEFWSPIPWAVDAYRLWFTLQDHGFRWADLFLSHEEHILAVPRLFFMADVHFFQASGKFLLVMNYVLALSIPLVIFSVSRRLFERRLDRWLYLSVLLGAYVNGVSMENLSWGFMIQHWLQTLSSVAFAAVFARLLAADPARAPLPLVALATLLALTAAFSTGGGVLCLVLAAGLAVVYRARWPLVLWAALSLAALVTVYLKLSPEAGAGGRFALVLARPADAVKFFLAFLGSPYLRCYGWPSGGSYWFFDGRLALGMGAAVFAAGAGLVLREVLRRDRDAFGVFHVYLILFAFGTGALATMARLNQGVYYGTVQKYACASLLAWIGIASLVLRQLGAARGPLPLEFRAPAWMAAFLAVLALALPAHFREERIFREWTRFLWHCETAMVAGVYDPPRMPLEEGYQPRSFEVAQQYLKPRRLGPFARYPFQVGDRLADFYQVAAEPCQGGFVTRQEARSDVAGGLIVFGWLCAPGRWRVPFDLVIADGSGRIVGIAHDTGTQPTIGLPTGVDKRQARVWEGYTRPVPDEEPLTAYALLGPGRVCLVARSVPVAGTLP